MKDAFGGSFILKIMLIFFVVFICFMTVAINFSKTFRIRSNVINILERSESRSFDDGTVEATIDSYLANVGYSYPGDTYIKVRENCTNQGGSLTERGVCVVSLNDGTYYKVIAYIVMEFPLFNTGMIIPISGETKVLKMSWEEAG